MSNQYTNEYFQWLCDLIKVNKEDKSYWLLAKTLHKKDFYWTVPNDDNRAEDGKKLRDKFAEQEDVNCFVELQRPCSVLEMLVALAVRMEDIMTDPDKDDRTSQWFWEMMKNCGLDEYTDEDFGYVDGPMWVSIIVNKVLDRGYEYDGTGGLFPLTDAKRDQRTVEIWYQMAEYLNEKLYLEDQIV